ncbi:MAG: agmatinase [Eubacteriales bacterium]
MKYEPQNASAAPRFTGIRTFMRLPFIKTTEDVDFAIVGIPFDTGGSYRSGQRFGPARIRENSTMLRPRSFNLGVNIFDYLSGIDYGDVPCVPGNIADTYRLIEETLKPLVENDIFPLCFGGDHSITLGELRAIAKQHGPVCLIHFDSHQDMDDAYWTDIVDGGVKYNHGTPFRRAIDEGLIDPEHSIQIGIRGTDYDDSDIRMSTDQGIRVITANELHEIGTKEACEIIKQTVGDRKAFLTFDVDFLDPAFAPGTGTIEIGGFSTYEAVQLIMGMKEIRFVGCDIVEVLPDLDHSNITCWAAASIAHEVISVIALQKKQGLR